MPDHTPAIAILRDRQNYVRDYIRRVQQERQKLVEDIAAKDESVRQAQEEWDTLDRTCNVLIEAEHAEVSTT